MKALGFDVLCCDMAHDLYYMLLFILEVHQNIAEISKTHLYKLPAHW